MNLDLLLEEVKPVIRQCKMARIIALLDEPYKEALTKLVATSWREGGLSDGGLARKLKTAGISVSHPTVYRHRSGQCSCDWIPNG
jgi:hypothetical protein